jgi:tRNA(fMet)-specific endonuclease VapC
MRFLLDTNACIHYLKFPNSFVARRLATITPADVNVCSVTKTELFYGAMQSTNSTQSLRKQQRFLAQFVSLPFDDQAALICGRIRAQLRNQGTPIGPFDSLIAVIALAHNLILVTNNTREFSRVADLTCEDWQLENP